MKAVPVLNDKAVAFGVNSPLRRAHFIAQVGYESSGFSRLTENLNYSADNIRRVFPKLAVRAEGLAHNPAKLADAAYGGRYGNSDEASGDGWRYCGRGLIQLTFKDNYIAAGLGTGLDLVHHPDLAADPANAALVALWYWQSHDCNDAADLDNCEAVTLKINGGVNGLADRERLTTQAKAIFA